MRRDLYYDLETTGLEPDRNDIVQLGAIMETGDNEVHEFNEFCQPFNFDTVSIDALRVNGRTMEELRSFQTPQEMFKKFIAFLRPFISKNPRERITLIGQNIIAFDNPFLKRFFVKNRYPDGFNRLFNYQFVDTLSLNYVMRRKGFMPENQSISLEKVGAFYGIETAKAHDALEDVRRTRKMLHFVQDNFVKDPRTMDLSALDPNSPLYQYLLEVQKN